MVISASVSSASDMSVFIWACTKVPTHYSLTRNRLDSKCGIIQVMTFVARGSGYIGRKLARVATRGKPLPPDMEPFMQILRRYSGLIMYMAWNLDEASPNRAQLTVRPDTDPDPDPDTSLTLDLTYDPDPPAGVAARGRRAHDAAEGLRGWHAGLQHGRGKVRSSCCGQGARAVGCAS